jgi:hypothetical protein
MRTQDLDHPALPRRGDAVEAARSPEEEVTLLELLDRVLDKGIVLSGEVTLSVADIDLVHVGLRVLLTSVETARAAARERSLEHAVTGAGR